jgi:hypothetical protein
MDAEAATVVGTLPALGLSVFVEGAVREQEKEKSSTKAMQSIEISTVERYPRRPYPRRPYPRRPYPRRVPSSQPLQVERGDAESTSMRSLYNSSILCKFIPHWA